MIIMENISKYGKQQNIKKPKELLGNWMETFSLDVNPASEVIPMAVLEYFPAFYSSSTL